MLKELQVQVPFNPPFVGEVEYKNIQRNKGDYPAWLVGYVGFSLSFGAKFFGGYRRDKAGVKDYQNELRQNLQARRNLQVQQNFLAGVQFVVSDYNNLHIPPNSLIYCDPPYDGATSYKDKFNHSQFWEWVRQMDTNGHKVFVSEYSAPDDFVCIWEKQVSSNLDVKMVDRQKIERLFVRI